MRSASRAVPSISFFTQSVVRVLGGACAAGLLLTTPALAGPEDPKAAPSTTDVAVAAVNSSGTTGSLTPAPARRQFVTDGVFRNVSFQQTTVVATPAPPPPVKRFKGVVGADMPTLYFFRGYRQESDPAFTFQPFIDVGISGGGAGFNLGTWNSFHTGSLDDAGAGYYETDLYAAVTLWKVKTTYTAYTYPNIDDSTIHEVMFSTAFSNSWAPSAAIAFEFDKPEGLDKGIYLELGVAPAIPLGKDSPVTLTIPVKIGLSLKDYYGEDTFGYISGGATLGHTFNDHFELHGGVLFYGFGDALKAVNNDSADEVVGSFGFSVSF